MISIGILFLSSSVKGPQADPFIGIPRPYMILLITG